MKKVLSLIIMLFLVIRLCAANDDEWNPDPEITNQLEKIKDCLTNQESDCNPEIEKGKRITVGNANDYLWFHRQLAMAVYRARGLDASIEFFIGYKSESIRLKHKEHEMRSYVALLKTYTKQSSFAIAIEAANTAISKAEQYQLIKSKIDFITLLGAVYRSKGDFKLAEENAFRAKGLSEEIGYDKGVADANLTLGTIFGISGLKEKSVEYFLLAAKSQLVLNDSMTYVTCLINAANSSLSLDSFDRSERLLTTAVDYLRKGSNSYIMAGALTQLGRTKMAKLNSKEALIYLEEAEELTNLSGNKKQASYIQSIMATAYLNIDVIHKAEEYALKAYVIHKTSINDETPAILKTLVKVFRQKGDVKSAFEYNQLYQNINDSLMGVDNAQKLLEVESEYKNKLKNEKIEKLEVQSELRRQRNTAAILIISLLALSGLLVVFWQRVKNEG